MFHYDDIAENNSAPNEISSHSKSPVIQDTSILSEPPPGELKLNSTAEETMPLRRSSRTIKPPQRLSL